MEVPSPHRLATRPARSRALCLDYPVLTFQTTPSSMPFSPSLMESLEPRRMLASISGLVYADSDVNGALTPGERHLQGWTVFADLNKNNRVDAGEPSTKTGTDGRYILAGLVA